MGLTVDIGELAVQLVNFCVFYYTFMSYRAITLSSIMVKLLEAVILTKLDSLLDTSYLQYGYKKTISTTFCTFTAQEVISYYVECDSSVICTLLDASKAFDRLNFCVLFTKLIERGLPLVIIRILIFVYIHQNLYVQWNDAKSDIFHVTNGVKQGGVLSPFLFGISSLSR